MLAAVCKNHDGEADEYAAAAADSGRVTAWGCETIGGKMDYLHEDDGRVGWWKQVCATSSNQKYQVAS